MVYIVNNIYFLMKNVLKCFFIDLINSLNYI